MRSIVWFRADLRVHDNAALHRAASVSPRGVIGVFLISPAAWREHDWAPCRVDLMMRCLRDLSTSLLALNIPLLILRADGFGAAPKALVSLAQRHACDAIHCNIEYEINESRRDDAVARAAAKAGIAFHRHHDQVVFPPDSIRTGQGTFYTVFTPFKKSWIKRVEETGGVAALRAFALPSKQDPTGIAPDPVPDRVIGFDSAISAALWPAGEAHAHRLLSTFVESKLRRYADDRDAPAVTGTSSISAYLALGVVSSRQCIIAAAAANRGVLDGPKNGPATWISEVIWREFYRHILVGFPRVCMHRPFKLETERLRWNDDPAAFSAWCQARTGVPIVDAAMRQLLTTGWMHNRARMITAMFLTKDLFIDWRRGERFFMQHLVDGDLASNNGGWQWSASTGTDAAPYFRIFNPISQSKANDPRGAFIRHYLPELAPLSDSDIHDPPPLARARLDYPMPIVDHAAARDRVITAFKSLANSD